MRTISLKVAGSTFQIRSDADEEYVEKLAVQVSERFSAIARRGPRQDHDFRAMTMVAIALLDELSTSQRQMTALESSTKSFVARIIDKIDGFLSQ